MLSYRGIRLSNERERISSLVTSWRKGWRERVFPIGKARSPEMKATRTETVDVRNERSSLKSGPRYFEGVVGIGVRKNRRPARVCQRRYSYPLCSSPQYFAYIFDGSHI